VSLLTYGALSLSSEAANCAATQELPNILWNRKFHYRVHNSPPLVPILNQIEPVHTTPLYLSKIFFDIILVFLVVSFLLAFPLVSYTHSSSSPSSVSFKMLNNFTISSIVSHLWIYLQELRRVSMSCLRRIRQQVDLVSPRPQVLAAPAPLAKTSPRQTRAKAARCWQAGCSPLWSRTFGSDRGR
jgi:hypothetical protein